MIKRLSWTIAAAICAGCIFLHAGCSKEEAAESVKNAEKTAEGAATAIAEGTKKAVAKGGEMADELGEKAMAYLTPLKEKFGNLDNLKDKPAELKTLVVDLIKSIEEKAEGIELPEAMSSALTTIKGKLVALRDYLEGEVEQAKIEEHIQGIKHSVESGLGLSQ